MVADRSGRTAEGLLLHAVDESQGHHQQHQHHQAQESHCLAIEYRAGDVYLCQPDEGGKQQFHQNHAHEQG